MKVSGVQNKLLNVKTGNKLLDRAYEVIPNTKVSKNLTRLDRDVFRAYCFALKNKTKISKEEVNNLFAKDGDDFIYSTYEFLCKKIGIDNSITPNLVICDEHPLSDAVAQYIPIYNRVQVYKKI